VPGLAARLGPDGRLLGHFPYPDAKPEELVTFAPGLRLRPDAARALQAMRDAAGADGITLRVLSAYRGPELQRQLFFDVKAERNQTSADRARVSAPPGFSEHSTGYAVDLGDGRLPATDLSEHFETTDGYRWLDRNAARFHFVRSFPKGNRQGVSYEPWHWRFEGSTEALEMFEPAQRLAR
jgi:D-alanyl-D-alanine carboxypeptidase